MIAQQRARQFALLVALLVLVLARPLYAQDAMAAEVLFNEGVALMQVGEFAPACAKIAESLHIEPRAGTLFTLAECHAGAGQTATALARYHEYLRWFGRMSEVEQRVQRGRDAVATKQVEELSASVPRLKIELVAPVPPGTIVKRNNIVVGAPSLGIWLPLDPGGHVIVAQAPAGPLTRRQILLQPGQREEVRLTVAPPTPTDFGPRDPRQTTPLAPLARPAADEAPMSKLAIGALLLGALSVVAVVAGTATGVVVLDQKASVDAQCGLLGDPSACTHEGKRTADRVQALAAASTASLVIGAASGGASLTLLLLDSPSSSSRPAAMAWLSYTAEW